MSRFPTRPRRWVAGATALVCAATVAVFAWPSPPATAAETLRQAVHAAVVTGSQTIAFDASVNGPSGSTASSGSGTVSFLNNEAVFSLSDSPAFPGGAELRITNDGVYLRAPTLFGNLLEPGMEWVKFPPLPQSSPTSTTTSTTTTTTSSAPPTTAASIIHAIEVMEAQGMVVDEAGQFVINGVQTDAYAFTDPDAADQLSGMAYVNQETGQLTRLEMNTVDATAAAGQLKIDLIKSADPVDVPTPPADTTVDIATVLAPKQ